VTTVLAVLIPAAASAGEPRVHDGGFFLRSTVGGGYARTADEEEGDRIALKGVSGTFDVAIGAMVKKNFAVHATLGGWSLVDPTVELNGQEAVIKDAATTVILIGGGFTYYLGPSNTYLTASVGASTLTFDFEGESHESGTGVAFEVGLGKEWWVSDRWGLGVSGTAGYHSVPTSDSASHFKGPSFAVRFSATFN
jgi:hypothetical protein